MQNPKSVIDAVIQAVEEAALIGGRPSLVSETAGETIDQTFIVIPRSELPVKQKSWTGHDIQFGTVGEDTCGGDISVLRRAGLSYLAMADYLGTKKSKKEDELKKRQFEIWKSFYPGSPFDEATWGLNKAHRFEQIAITSIIELQDQLAEATQN